LTPERYKQINDLADAALPLDGERRATFLDEVCSGDESLRREIEALLEADSSPADFLDRPVLEVLAGDMAERPSHRDLVGRRFEDYEVISHLGAGGIGEVWLARDLKLRREVALKLLSPKFAGDPKHVRRFQQEARAASTLNHPNIVTVYEIGTSGGVEFIAEERVVGETIRQKLARGPLPLPDTLEIGAQAAAALGAAHSAGVVHRDIKPENVIVRPDGLVKVLDFGLARFVERRRKAGSTLFDSLSVPGFVLGTVRYMSPEQARGLPVDGRSDVFSLGVMLYEMVSGTPPFSGATPTDTLAAILMGEPAPLSQRVPGIPAEFERIVRRCLAKEPSGRYSSADELRQDLQRLASRPKTPDRRRAVLAGAVAFFALIVIAAIYVLSRGKAPSGSFNSMRIARVVTRSEAADTAISPDGKLLAYVVNEPAGQSVWIRRTASSDEAAAVPGEPGAHSDLVFSPDGNYLYYRRRTPGDTGGLYRVPVGGGVAQRILGEIAGAPAFSPDGRRLAFVRLTASSWEASVIVANPDGSGAFTLATARRPRFIDQHTLAWSPDGRSIACFTGEATRITEAGFHLVEIRLADRVQRVISNQSWAWPRSVSWAAQGDALIVNAASREDDVYQLWMVARRDGHITRITNDLSNYSRTTVTADGGTLAALQQDTSAAIWVAPSGDSARAARISGDALRSVYIEVGWTPAGSIVYTEPAGDYRNLWVMDADGRNRRPLTSGAGNKGQISIARDGRYIVFKQGGGIWRMDADGANPVQLTHGPLDVHPDLAPDARSVVYTSFTDWSPAIGGEPTLWRVPIDGGPASQIAAQPASYPRVSPDGKRVGCVYFPGKDPRFSANHLAVFGLDATGGFRIFDASPSEETSLAWSPDGQALDFIVNRGGVGNIWRQPLSGGPATRVTNFMADELYTFAWSRDGRLVCARGATTTSVVLIENFR
jgi:serine/threonine protein kinase/Tol biopolymer transport system component